VFVHGLTAISLASGLGVEDQKTAFVRFIVVELDQTLETRTLDEMGREIRHSIVAAPFDFARKSVESVCSRLQKYVQISGAHFEI
jgi:hypothetical protein